MIGIQGIELPDENYHTEKRNRFGDAADFLARSNRIFSHDPSVQDYFYSAMHEAESFLARLGIHSRNHNQRENFVTNYMVQSLGTVVSRAQFSRNPRHPADRLFDNDSEFYYMQLLSLRLDVVYGNEILGRLRHANRRDVQRARELRVRFLNSISRHEQNLRHRGII